MKIITEPHRAIMMPPRPLRQADWAIELSQFSRRNFGRLATIDLDDPELDPQVLVANAPLLGVSYDSGDGIVEVMLGDDQPDGRHLTHPIRDVTSISVIRGDESRDVALRIAHGAGLTRLTLAP